MITSLPDLQRSPHDSDLSSLTRILAVTATTITVEASIAVSDLLSFLLAREQTVTGLINSSSSLRNVIPYDQVVTLLGVRSDGTLATSLDNGVILYSVTLRTSPAQTLYLTTTFTSLPLDFVGWLQTGQHRQFLYNPYTNHVLLYNYSLTPSGEDRVSLGSRLISAHRFVYRHTPLLIPRYLDLLLRVRQGQRSGTTDVILRPPVVTSYQLTVPPNRAVATLSALHDCVMRWKNQGSYLYDCLLISHRPDGQISFGLALDESDESQALVDELSQL